MAISKEKVCGWLVYYGSGEIGQYPGGVIELEVIPEVWELYVAKYPKYFDTSDDSEYYGFFAWKRELSFDEKIKRDTGYSLKPIQDLLNKFLVFEVWCLKNWNDFCAEYQRLTPEQIQTAKKFCVLDSVTTPAAPVEYVLDITVRNRSGNVWSFVTILGPLSSPAGFDSALTNNQELKDLIIRYTGKNGSGENEFNIRERTDYFSQYPKRKFNTLAIPELADFVKAYNAGGSQAAPASGSFLVCSDSAPADPVAVPAGFVPVLIQGKYTEIQEAVRDSKRETTLTENKKQTGIMQDGVIETKKQTGIQEQILEEKKTTNELLRQIAENTSSGNAKPKTRLEELRKTYWTYRRNLKYKQNLTRYVMVVKHKCDYEDIWKIEHWEKDWDSVDVEIKRREIANIRAGVSQAKSKNPKID